jgi:GT2 family glycosyltransferase
VRTSFILPLYGGEETLPACLDHLLAQRLGEWECIGVDDASPDRSAAVFEGYAARDSRLKLIRHEKNRGVAQSRQTGLDIAQGEYIHFLDQDDHLLPDGIRRLERCLKMNADAAAAFGNPLIVSPLTGFRRCISDWQPRLEFADIALASPFTALVVLHKRTLIERVGGMATGVDGCDEWDLWGRLTRAGYPLVHCDTLVGEYRIHDKNTSHNSVRLLLNGLRVLETMHGPDPRVSNPAHLWADGTSQETRDAAFMGLFWLQTGSCLARRDVNEALRLADVFLHYEGAPPLTVESVTGLHHAMPYGRFLVGSEADAYFEELYDVLTQYFELLGPMVTTDESFAEAALAQLRARYIISLLAENRRLQDLVEHYKSSRSFRIGWAVTRAARFLWPRSR